MSSEANKKIVMRLLEEVSNRRVHRLVAEGDLVNVHATVSGTHRGDFMGVPPTGRRVRMPLMETFRLVDGKVAEMWVVADQLSLLQQMGVIPTSDA